MAGVCLNGETQPPGCFISVLPEQFPYFFKSPDVYVALCFHKRCSRPTGDG